MSGTLYRLFDAEGELLYVGASMNGALRVGSHQSQPWWEEVASASFQHYETRDEAAEAEKAILSEGPLPRHNGNRPRKVRTEAEIAASLEARRQRDRRIRASVERERREYHHVRGLRCSNCGWDYGQIRRGKLIAETPCPKCRCKTLIVPDQPREKTK